jgi:ClpP class serine protease
MRFQRIHEAVHFRPWFISAAGYASVRSLVDKAMARDIQSRSEDLDEWFSDFVRRRPTLQFNAATRTATISIFGVVGPYLSNIEKACGNTGYEEITAEIEEAKQLGAERINFHFDSPGGYCTGCDEVARAIAAIKDETSIFTVAHTDTVMCSAAYYLAAGCSAIVGTRSATIGNIGVILPWVDSSKLWEIEGLEFQPIVSEGADLKATMHGPELSADQRAFLQDDVNENGRLFREHVTRNRPNLDPEVWRAGWYGGEMALDLGLIDMVGTLAETIG